MTSVALKCTSSWSKKSSSVQNLSRELESLKKVLLELQNFSEQHSKQLPALQSLNEPEGVLDQMQKTLEKLVDVIIDAGHGKKGAGWAKRGRAVLGWSLLEKEIEAVLRCLERYKSSLLLTLGQDSLYRPLSSLFCPWGGAANDFSHLGLQTEENIGLLRESMQANETGTHIPLG